jgi:hypothetical protein
MGGALDASYFNSGRGAQERREKNKGKQIDQILKSLGNWDANSNTEGKTPSVKQNCKKFKHLIYELSNVNCNTILKEIL